MRVVYLHGFASGPASTKATFFSERLRACGVEVSIPDLAAGDFENMTITSQLAVIEGAVGDRETVLIGSSMGGYLASLFAARHPTLVSRVILMAPAFCFTKRWPDVIGEAAMDEWRRSGRRTVFHYGEKRECKLSYVLVEDGSQYEDFPAVDQAVLILHGRRDDVVPWTLSGEFEQRRPETRRLVLFDSGHELTDVTDRLWQESASFLGLAGDCAL